MSTIDPNDSRITAYVFGELHGAEKEAFDAELEQSEQLRRIVDQTRQTIAALSSELQAEPQLGMSDEQRQHVQQMIAQRHAASRTDLTEASGERFSSRRRVFWSLAVAASLLLLCGVTYVVAVQRGNLRQLALRRRAVDRPAATEADRAVVVAQRLQRLAEEGEESALSTYVEEASSYTAPSDPLADAETAAREKAVDANYGVIRGPRDINSPVPASAAPAAGSKTWASLQDQEQGVPAHPRLVPSSAAPLPEDQGWGPGRGGDKFSYLQENSFKRVLDGPLSTFSIDVDTASYSKVRMYLMQHGALPRADAVRIEELVNYFVYDYQPPSSDVPFSAHMEIAQCPWNGKHRLARIGIKGKQIDQQRPASNLVFLLDVSGSMNPPNKLPLLKRGMKMLVDQLTENDQVSIVVYAGAAGAVLEPTSGDNKPVILGALERLHAGGSTNGGEGIQLAYQRALDHFIEGGVNRVILCTDGDFNVGVTGTDELVRLAETNARAGVFLTVLGFGMGNHNDAMLEQISNKGNGNYAFIDTDAEARKVLIEQMQGTLVTIAKDVKIQVEFNPQEVQAYRLIGYENRILAAEDFNDDKKDAGEIGAGHTVTALYEIVPAGTESDVSTVPVDDLKYQKQTKLSQAAGSGEMLTLKIRYKQPDEDTSRLLSFPVKDAGKTFGQADKDFRFAAAVASFGMLLRDSQHKGDATYDAVLEIAQEAASDDSTGYRQEFLELVKRARQLSPQ